MAPSFACGQLLPGQGELLNFLDYPLPLVIDGPGGGGGGGEQFGVPPPVIPKFIAPGDGTGPPGPGPVGPGWATWWVCTGPPQWRCDGITQSIELPPPPGGYKSREQCIIHCVGAVAPKTGGGGSGGGTPPGGGGGPLTPRTVTWWLCTGAPNWRCKPVNIDVDQPPPAGAHKTKGACVVACKAPEGPFTPRYDRTGGGKFGRIQPDPPEPGGGAGGWNPGVKTPGPTGGGVPGGAGGWNPGVKTPGPTGGGTPGGGAGGTNPGVKTPGPTGGGTPGGGAGGKFVGILPPNTGVIPKVGTPGPSGGGVPGGGAPGVKTPGPSGGGTPGGGAGGKFVGILPPNTGVIPKVGTPGSSGGGGGTPPGLGTYPFQPISTPSENGAGGSLPAQGAPLTEGLGMMPVTAPLIEETRQGTTVLNLNNPQMNTFVAKNYPTGLLDPATAIMSKNPTTGPIVDNDILRTDIFKRNINKSIFYIHKHNNTFEDWRPGALSDLTTQNIILNLQPSFLKTLRSITRIDGLPLSDREIAFIVKSRVVNGTIDNLRADQFTLLGQQKSNITPIIRNSNPVINTIAALNLIDLHKIPLDPNSLPSNSKQKDIAKNWKTLATDTGKYIPCVINGEAKKFYIGDDDVVVQRANLTLNDGDFVIVNGKRLYAKSQVGHSYTLPVPYQQQILNLLGGTGEKTLTVSSTDATDLEYNYSLNLSGEAPLPDFMFFKIVLSSIYTTQSPASPFLKSTTAAYELIDYTTAAGLAAVQDWIKYKMNYGVQFIDYDDPFAYYASSTGTFSVTREDFLPATNKTNPDHPNLVRNIPWSYILFPSNRDEYLVQGNKSVLTSLDSTGKAIRTLTASPTLNKEFTEDRRTQWIEYKNAYNEGTTNVFQNSEDLNARVAVFNPDLPIFKTGYRVGNKVGSAVTQKPSRTKTTLRLVNEIIKELNANYVIKKQGGGVSLLEWDVISRLSAMEFNKFVALENVNLLWPKLRDGLVENITIYPSTKMSGGVDTHTQLDRRRSTGVFPDKFAPVMSLIDDVGVYVLPPATTRPNSSAFGVPSTKASSSSRTR